MESETVLVQFLPVVLIMIAFAIGNGFLADAVNLPPRIGHLHVTVDDSAWHWGDFSDNKTIVVVGLLPVSTRC